MSLQVITLHSLLGTGDEKVRFHRHLHGPTIWLLRFFRVYSKDILNIDACRWTSIGIKSMIVQKGQTLQNKLAMSVKPPPKLLYSLAAAERERGTRTSYMTTCGIVDNNIISKFQKSYKKDTLIFKADCNLGQRLLTLLDSVIQEKSEDRSQAMPDTATPQLPTDVFRLVFVHLEANDIRVVRRVCKDFYELSNLRSVWSSLLQKQVIQQNIPVPGLCGRSLELLSAREVEICLHRALALRRNWISESPVIKRRVSVEAIPQHRIVSIHFLSGNGPPRLLSLSMSQNRTFTIQCWDLQGQEATCIASRELLRFRGIAVNKVVSDSGMVAVLNPHLEILSLGLEASNSEHGFVASTVVPEEIHGVHFFFGSTLLTRDRNGRLYAWDINRPQVKVELQNPGLVQNTTVIDVVITRDSVMVLRQTTLELYALPYPIPTFSNSGIIPPIYVLNLPGRVDNGVMTIRYQPQRTGFENVYIVVRYGSLFPWALNILHHYEIHANPAFSKDRPMSPINLPYKLPPVLQEIIAAPVRLHATSDLVIGEHGTIVWTDSHTEDYFNHADRGQRLAGRFAPFAGEGAAEDGVDLPSQIATATAETVYAFHEEDSWVRIALDETEGRIALGHDDGLVSVLEYV